MAAAISSHNPFRNPQLLLPNGPPALPPRRPTQSVSVPVADPLPDPSPHSLPEDDSSGLAEELPPAYTPAPDSGLGESTIEYGPRRPFQPPPQPPPQSIPPPQSLPPPQPLPQLSVPVQPPTLWSQLTGHSTEWYRYPSQRTRISQLAYNGPTTTPPPPPQRVHARSTSPRPTPASHFARDFYAAGAADSQSHSHSVPTYAPPPGPPPPPRSPTSPSVGPPNPADSHPTSVPKPGHPLLKDGKLLVYPPGYECPKCLNLGYKHMDPTHPCKRCWSKYAKPFHGPLVTAYTNRASSSSPSSSPSSVFQRPLPSFHPPPQSSQPHARAVSHPPYSSPNANTINTTPNTRANTNTRGMGTGPGNVQIRALSPYAPPPPPNAVVYSAGDVRLGGRLCERCEGTGTFSLFLFDRTSCFVCGGVGRVY